MKRALLLVFSLCIAVGLAAQVTFGPKLGFNLSKYAYNYSSDFKHIEPQSKFRLGFAVGGMMNLDILEFLAFQPSLMIAKKGSGIDVADEYSGNAVITGYKRTRVTYLEVPLNLALKLKVGAFKFQIFAGPYIAYALAGKTKWDYEKNDDGIRTDHKGEEKISLKNEIPADAGEKTLYYQSPLDIGMNFGFGYQVNHVLINLGFAMGFSNLQPDKEGVDSYSSDFKYSNRTIFLSAAWLFGGE